MRACIASESILDNALIPADQEFLKAGILTVCLKDLADYKAAQNKSQEALCEYLARLEERNSRLAGSQSPVPVASPIQPKLPLVALNETISFLQEAAEHGIYITLSENAELIAVGNRYVIDDWRPYIKEKRADLRQALIEIEVNCGEYDPLGLLKRLWEFNYEQEVSALEIFQKTMGIVHAILRHQRELKEDLGWEIFPEEQLKSPESIISGNAEAVPEPQRYPLLSLDHLFATRPFKYRVKSILPREGLSALFGPPGAAKTFIALDLAISISDGREWFGYRVEPCDVIYICLEGQGGLPQRLKAYCKHWGDGTGERLKFITAPFSLLGRDDVDALIRTWAEAGSKARVIVIDTLSAATAGLDENSSADMGRILQSAKRIYEEIGGLVILIHHSGKDASKGLRGHSSMHASLDSLIHVIRSDSRRSWTLVKSKDGLDGEEHGFELGIVELELDEDGDVITSCVIIPGQAAKDRVRRVKLPSGENQKVVYELACELLQKTTDFGQGGAPATKPCIRVDALISACYGKLAVVDRRVPERAKEAIAAMEEKGLFVGREKWLWLP